jgi:hypothetical protein
MAKEVARTDMLVDISQLHENHLHSLDIQMNNSASILTDFVRYTLQLHPKPSQVCLCM